MFKKSLLLCAILIFAIIPFVSSAPPVTTVQQITNGYIIEDSPQTILKQNQDYQYNFFVYNLSNGLLKDNLTVTCVFYLSNSYGDVIYTANSSYYKSDGHWSNFISGGNFSNIGFYFYGVKCLSATLGGAVTGSYEVTLNGEEITVSRSIINIGLLLLFVIFLITSLMIFMESQNLLAKVGMFGLSYLLLIAITFISWSMASNFLPSITFIASMFRILFFVLIIGAFPLLIGAFAWYVLMLFKIKEIERLMTKGFSFDEAERRQGHKYK